jgi:carboxyl-terminal processing protease
LQKYNGFDDFNKQFNITRVLLEEFIAYAGKNGVAKDNEGFEYANSKISTLLKAYISRNLYDDNGFYPIFLSIDKPFIEAMAFINQQKN